MSASPALIRAPAATRWIWPIDLSLYDRSPDLTFDECAVINTILKGRMQAGYLCDRRRAPLGRLLDPMLDALKITEASKRNSGLVIKVILRHMQKSRCSFWMWTESEWGGILHDTIADFETRNAVSRRSRPYLIALCVLLGRVRDLRHLGNFDRIGLATKVFGSAVELSTKRVAATLTSWGYSADLDRTRTRLRSSLCEIFLLNRSPLLEDISSELLVELHRTRVREESRWTIQRISNALCALKVIEAPIRHGFEKARGGQERDIRIGVSNAWQAVADRWLATSTLSENGRIEVYYLIMKAGRWITATRSEVASPELWTRETAAYVAAVCRMNIGDWVTQVKHPSDRGKPLTPRSICGHLSAVRTFFRDCHEWEWVPRRFDPNRCLKPPASVKSRIGPDPRVVADDVWAKLVWAGLNLEESDLRLTGSHHFYPLALVRAITMVWLFAGLRCDEILRLRVGSIRWKDNDDQSGGPRTCLLHVPVNKTSTAFVKPVDPIVGEAIGNWEAVRPKQPAHLDKKTGELVDLVFFYRTRRVSARYLNQVVIPALCTKAGVPRRDARGAITSHRARATIAIQLYNAKEPLSLFELQEWMGHRSAQSTQHYAKISATKMARSYARAGYFERNLRAIDVLIDQEAVRSGTAANVPWKSYDLGHGYCTYDFFDQCPHRMACARCSFYSPKPSAKAQALEGKANLLRLRQEIPLQDSEISAVDDGIAALEALIDQLIDTPTPAGPTPRQLQAGGLVQIQLTTKDGYGRLD